MLLKSPMELNMMVISTETVDRKLKYELQSTVRPASVPAEVFDWGIVKWS